MKIARSGLGRAWRVVAASAFSAFACDSDVPPTCVTPSAPARDVPGFHGDREKLGSTDVETVLMPASIRRTFGKRWSSASFESAVVADRSYAAHAYASPLYLADVPAGGARHDVVISATSSGDVYALSAFGASSGNDNCAAPGSTLWRTRVVTPAVAPHLDGGVPVGILSTPIADRVATPPRLYVVALDADRGWSAFALDLATGAILKGWPVVLDGPSLEATNTNGPARFHDPREISQRGALALSPAGDRLYVGFGSFRFASVGWLAAIDTRAPKVARSFSSAPFAEPTSNGGIWGAGGSAVDETGDVWIATGNSPAGTADAPRTWGNSVLRLSPELQVRASYTPFNYCKLDEHNIDLAGSAPLLLPSLGVARTSTPNLLAVGGKQGTVILLDRDSLPIGRDRRPACSDDPATDQSLHAPTAQPQFGKPGPLNVFGPYSDERGEVDYAKMRSRPAYHRGDDGTPYLFVSGSTKAAPDSTQNVPPGLARLAVVLEPGRSAHLRLDATATTLSFVNPGSPIVTSHGGREPVVWVVDENAPRSASLLDPATPGPVLYAVDGRTMEVLYRSPAGALAVGGKYVTPVVARGMVFVTTERLEAFGLAP